MIVGIKKVVCTCGKDMTRTGGVFGEIMSDTYFCKICQRHVIVVTPNWKDQEEFAQRLKAKVA